VQPESPESLAAAIVRLLTEPGLRARLVEGGRGTLSRYSEPELIARIEALYGELLAG
jgi:glycosyltransferase involved in cell wall biosynthesis